MDPATPVHVAKSAVATCEFVLPALVAIAAGTFTAIHALYRGSRHPTPLALSAAVNGGVAGTLFFGLREVLVSPLLQSFNHSTPNQGTSSTPSPQSWSQMRTHKLPDSALSGAFTGGILNAWQYGRARIWAGARTAAIICTVLQLGYNELGVTRVKFVSRKIKESQSQPDAVSVPDAIPVPDAPRLSIFDRLMGIVGFRKLTDEEYLEALKKQRDEALVRIAAIEQERSERRQLRNDSEDSTEM
ncbi:hypothetical protein L226DRAFT_566853 [Lentinus tigrinus ALCF2SS1-7]|uniref:Uncharacterized protein n=1 Tax=Lentinus tigrinus ALCF2SS1-6 TaxID=1328759 RepID=A0A5C2STN5_9APHY|nr:hypothetical protein L227DRAFT_649145 [Lentinus tigrinus ALCF2SS1-6]RPD80353.1 hypothetical protein L226DRAFT_566853 [Lentinus tigrinus ALCF2SS1-7]